MNFLNQLVPKYVYKKQNQVKMVVFAALFALVFINIYQPFNSGSWGNVSELLYIFYSSLLVLAGLMVVAISRVLMHFYTKKHEIEYWRYGLWVGVELVLMATIYTICSVSLGMQTDAVEAFEVSFRNTSLVLLLPYVICIIYFAKQDKARLLEQIENEAPVNSPKLVSFYDEKNELRLSVKKENLVYLEAADNYICIWYMNSGVLKRTFVRNTMKSMAQQLAGTNVMRCHRSYMVNLDQVKVIRREKEGVFLELGIEGVKDIPISKTYSDSVLKWLMM